MEPTISADGKQSQNTKEASKVPSKAMRVLRILGRPLVPLLVCFGVLWGVLGAVSAHFSGGHESVSTQVWTTAGFAALCTVLFGIARLLLYLLDLGRNVGPSSSTSPEGRAWLKREADRTKAEAAAARRREISDVLEGLRAVAVLAVVIGGLGYGGCYVFGQVADRVDEWQMSRALEACRANLQADLVELLGIARDPTVTKCVGKPTQANCFFQALEDGGYKTRPVVGDCSRRHLETGIRDRSQTSPKEWQRFRAQADAFEKAVRDAK